MDPNTENTAPEVEVDNSIMDFLTDEEREALEDSDFIEDESDDAAGDDAEASGDEAEASGDEAPQPDADPQPAAQVPDVDMAQLDEQIAAFKQQRADLLEQYDDGDLTGAELQAKLDELDEQADAVKVQKAIAQQQIQQVEQSWKSAVTSHLDAYPELKANDQVLQGFDAAVRSVTGNPAYAHMTFDQQLTAAHELLAFQAKHTGLQGVPPLKGQEPQPKPEAKPEAKPEDKAKGEGKTDMRTPPPTLANTPASDISGGSDSPYASLERLAQSSDPADALRLEEALSRLTPEQRDEFSSMVIG